MEGVYPRVQTHKMNDETVFPRFKDERPRYFFREWRKYRSLTQEQLGGRVDMTASSISQLETGKQGFTDRTLAAIAKALDTDPGSLLMRDPLKEDAIWSLLDGLKPTERDEVVRFISYVKTKRTGTEG